MSRLSQNTSWEQLSDDIQIDFAHQLYCSVYKCTPEELSAQLELAERMEAQVFCEGRTYDSLWGAAQEVSEKYELPYGMALPSISDDKDEGANYCPILARGTPLSTLSMCTEMEQRLIQRKLRVRNSWDSLGDKSVAVVNTDDGPMALTEWHAGNRFRKFFAGLEARINSPMSAESELKAIELLKTKVTESQFRCYILNNAFLEHSKKSDLFYIFRKGLPVVVISYHKEEHGSLLCTLCIHPYGYYQFTHAGVMCPTDEVIGQLLLMRANEKKFWGKAGQWSVSDPRSGL